MKYFVCVHGGVNQANVRGDDNNKNYENVDGDDGVLNFFDLI